MTDTSRPTASRPSKSRLSESRPSLVIDVFSDFVCPWCFVGHHRLKGVLAEYADTVDVDLRHRPFLLDPATPPEGIHVPTLLKQKYGGDPVQLHGHVQRAAAETGLDFDPNRVEWMVPTLAAHTLSRHAVAKGTQHALVEALFAAYFQQIRNISTIDVLVDVATRHGFTEDEVREIVADRREEEVTRDETQRAVQLGITGVPFFVFGGTFALSGAQPPAVFRKAIERALG